MAKYKKKHKYYQEDLKQTPFNVKVCSALHQKSLQFKLFTP